jgi:nitric oxide dioxygenase
VEIPANAQVYLCGPLPFMESVRSSLIGQHVAEADIHDEVFGPDKWLASA